jgi:hypothetical protein
MRPPAYKLVVSVPETHTESVLSAIGEAGGGTFGDQYDYCAFIVRGEGRFRPLSGANPFIGAVGKVERVSEDRVEVTVLPERLDGVIAAIRAAHPYEVPVIDVFALSGP